MIPRRKLRPLAPRPGGVVNPENAGGIGTGGAVTTTTRNNVVSPAVASHGVHASQSRPSSTEAAVNDTSIGHMNGPVPKEVNTPRADGNSGRGGGRQGNRGRDRVAHRNTNTTTTNNDNNNNNIRLRQAPSQGVMGGTNQNRRRLLTRVCYAVQYETPEMAMAASRGEAGTATPAGAPYAWGIPLEGNWVRRENNQKPVQLNDDTTHPPPPPPPPRQELSLHESEEDLELLRSLDIPDISLSNASSRDSVEPNTYGGADETGNPTINQAQGMRRVQTSVIAMSPLLGNKKRSQSYHESLFQVPDEATTLLLDGMHSQNFDDMPTEPALKMMRSMSLERLELAMLDDAQWRRTRTQQIDFGQVQS